MMSNDMTHGPMILQEPEYMPAETVDISTRTIRDSCCEQLTIRDSELRDVVCLAITTVLFWKTE